VAPLLFLAGLCLLALPGVTRRFGRRLHPGEWSRLCLAAFVAGGAAVEVAAVLYGLPVVLRAFGVTGLADACERTFDLLLHGDANLVWFAVGVALWLPARAVRGVLRTRRLDAAVRGYLTAAERHAADGYELVVVPTDVPVAVAIDGQEPLVVISEGVRARLSASELHAVVRHEAAHLQQNHQRYLLVASALERLVLFPGVRRSTAALRAALERWADEEAAAEPGCSRQAVRQALLGMVTVEVGLAFGHFSAAESVLERLEALDAEPRTPPLPYHAALYAPGVVIAVAAAIGVGGWTSEVDQVLALAGTCVA
jgi:hypothetical protein